MSYCRWSSDNWKSDIYCYTSGQGHIIDVANRKRVGEIPEVNYSSDMNDEELREAINRQRKALDDAELVPIGLPKDGAHIVCETLEELLNEMIKLKKMGYHVPERAIHNIAVDTGKDTGTTMKNKI